MPPSSMIRRLLVVLLAAVACDDPVAPLPSAGAPRSLEILASYFGSGTTRVRLDGSRLAYAYVPWGTTTGRATDSVAVTPDSAAWAAFWRGADRAGLGSWPRECVNRDVVDGGGISVDIAHAGGRLQIATSNAYPGRGGRCDRTTPTPELAEFLAAVSALVGRPFPGGASGR
jgi:hypothetical protein